MKHFYVIMCAVLLTGCATMEPSPSSVRGTYPLATWPGSEVITTVRGGSLHYSSGCLLFRDADKRDFVPVFTDGSRFDGRVVAVVQPGGERVIGLGQRITIEGDGKEWSSVPPGYNLSAFQKRCSVSPFFITHTK